MNICLGDTGIAVDFIQSFLQNNYSNTIRVSGIYDNYTHSNLISYLQRKSVMDINGVYDVLMEKFPDLLYYFILYKNVDNIICYSKSTNNSVIEFMESIRSDIMNVVDDCGWTVTEFREYEIDGRFKISMKCKDYKNVIPCNDLLPLVNLFCDEYKYDYTISQNTVLPLPTRSTEYYKLAILECQPNTEYTICHAYNGVVNMTIASTSYHITSLDNALCTNVRQIYLGRETSYKYTTSEDAITIIVQLRYNRNIENSYDIDIPIIMGDVNLDGKVDEDDYNLLQSYIFGYIQLYDEQLFSSNITNHESYKDVDIRDLQLLREYIDNGINGGIKNYTQTISSYTDDSNMLLITRDNGMINYPLTEYSYKNKWSVHERLMDYIYGIAVTEYSSEENIRYLQERISSVYGIELKKTGIYDDRLKDLVYNYQLYCGIPFALGYMDVPTESSLVKDEDAHRIIEYIE